jgi:hypothetical protein
MHHTRCCAQVLGMFPGVAGAHVGNTPAHDLLPELQHQDQDLGMSVFPDMGDVGDDMGAMAVTANMGDNGDGDMGTEFDFTTFLL